MPEWILTTIDALDLPDSQHVIRIVAAVILGGLIGLERELRDKPVGFRTIVLICLGACTFTIVSQLSAEPGVDTSRIAAQIVSGIGFLGAGAIIRDRASIKGLTTAATIWSVAAVGMCVGYGHIGLAALGTVAILITLFAFDLIEQWIGNLRDLQDYVIAVTNTEDALDKVNSFFRDAGVRPRKQTCFQEENLLVVRIRAMASKAAHARLLKVLARSKDYVLRRK